MKKKLFIISLLLVFNCIHCKKKDTPVSEVKEPPFLWENAIVYFLLTDRFNNGDPSNDLSFDRQQDGAKLRSFMGGDIKGITKKIEEGYFNKLGINAIWFTPPVEQVHGFTDEGTGKTYGYHGYWTFDWTRIDPNYGTWEDLKAMVDKAHAQSIRIVMDVVLNHTGPEIAGEPAWPESWVRTSPKCRFENFESTVTCTLVDNLPDIRTEKKDPVDLPEFLIDKWEKEGRLDLELSELENFFERTGYPRAPKYYIIKWLTDFVRELGIDGFRVDTAKHTEPDVWQDLWDQVVIAFRDWKENHPDEVLDQNEFFMVGEVYGFNIQNAPFYDFGDTLVNFYDYGFKSLINFAFKTDAEKSMEEIFSDYSKKLNNQPAGFSVMNYISSHDDSQPFDLHRTRVFEAGTKLLLSPGAVQIYYGDETARPLEIEDTQGDAHLRSFMNWGDLENNVVREGYSIQEVYQHWSKLSHFRKEHPAVGAGRHRKINDNPYIFTRTMFNETIADTVMVIIDPLENTIAVNGLFPEGTQIKDYYSNQLAKVEDDQLRFDSLESIVLLGKPIIEYQLRIKD
jgi:alpha-amylase